MTKREIMVEAVALAKKMVGDWIARMSIALKTVWAIAKKKVESEVKYYVRSEDWTVEEMFYSVKDVVKFLDVQLKEFNDIFSRLDPGKADYWNYDVNGTECKVYVMKA